MQKALLIFVVSNAFLMLIFSLYHSKNLIATVDSKMIANSPIPLFYEGPSGLVIDYLKRKGVTDFCNR